MIAAPSGSADPALEKLTASGAAPLVGFAAATADGGWLVLTLRMRRIAPALSFSNGPVSTYQSEPSGPCWSATMSPYGPSSDPSGGSKLRTALSPPLALNSSRLIQFWA